MNKESDVIDFGEMRLKLRGKRCEFSVADKDRCRHRHLTMDDNGDIVRCTDCNEQVSAYWALKNFVSYWSEHSKKIERRRAELNSDIEKHLSLTAARQVERSWRSRTMMPACPHCQRGIGPKDHFGASCVNAEIEMRRREVEKQK